jgi:hypothetical protein
MKIAIFTFNGEMMSFAHALLNTLDLYQNGNDVKLIIEGNATSQIANLKDSSQPFGKLYSEIIQLNLIDCVCNVCAGVTGSLEAAIQQNLPICGEMSGHPSMRKYLEQGYEIVVF